ncbi:MAG: Histidinol-phosphate aminotransferase [Candidatus Accumulibacter sp. SK-11]|nr:MAG: Histidinol-phosphate aminotransferase [Candidatus Accumulibacter sp. SK-11]
MTREAPSQHWPERLDRSARARHEQLQLLSARSPGDRRCSRCHRRQGVLREDPTGGQPQSRNAARALLALGFDVLPSAANFIFVRHPQHDAGELAARLRQRGIIVRHFRLPRIEQYLRITVGSDEQCNLLLQALQELLARR